MPPHYQPAGRVSKTATPQLYVVNLLALREIMFAQAGKGLQRMQGGSDRHLSPAIVVSSNTSRCARNVILSAAKDLALEVEEPDASEYLSMTILDSPRPPAPQRQMTNDTSQKSNRSMLSFVNVNGLPSKMLSLSMSIFPSRPALSEVAPGFNVPIFSSWAAQTVR